LAGCVNTHVPPFASRPYEPFARADAVAIATDEWRLWGERVDDDGRAGYEQTDATMGERQPGLWERVGEYWWEGLNPGEPDTRWTGKHDAAGHVFAVAVNGHYAWSAAFISYVMRIAGAGPNFPYAPDHATYINYAAQAARGEVRNPLLIARDPKNYAPRLGDLVCFGRGRARDISFAQLPTPDMFPAHCSIVTAVADHSVSVIGGNVEDAVALERLYTDDEGRLAGNRYNWFVILQVIYTR
jgi:hypothetical protein